MYTNTNQTDWDEFLPLVTFAYNTDKQDTTQFSPFMLLYAREPVLPTEANLQKPTNNTDIVLLRERALTVRNQAIVNISNKQQKDKSRNYENHRHLEFSTGDQDKVFTPVCKVVRSEKLLLKWFGPYYIVKKIGEVNYEIRKEPSNNCKKDIVHVSRVLPYNDPWTPDVYPINS